MEGLPHHALQDDSQTPDWNDLFVFMLPRVFYIKAIRRRQNMVDQWWHLLPISLNHENYWKMHEARNIRTQRRPRESFSKANSESKMNLPTEILDKLQKERYTTQTMIEELECCLYGKEPSTKTRFKDDLHTRGSSISDISEVSEMTKNFTFPAYDDLETTRENHMKSFTLKPAEKEDDSPLDRICDSLTKLLEEAEVALSRPVPDESIVLHRKDSVDTTWDSASTISAQSEQIMTPVDCGYNNFDAQIHSRHSSLSMPGTPGTSFMEEMFDDEPIEKPLPPPLTPEYQQSCENLENEIQHLSSPTMTTANTMNNNEGYFDYIKQDESVSSRAKLQQFINNVSTFENVLTVTGFLFGFAQIVMAIKCRSSNRLLIEQSPKVRQTGKKSMTRILKYLGVFSVGWAIGRNSDKSKQPKRRYRYF
ncbi:9046_t:CDS:2 [Ambispora gerdemannii]|uniref:9046_t:CDS:1 n=1 Tax=Ambispora gerdemannii TaxID=144530 RepID=A0A9N8ZFS8_9GLOM|nr:9046_t:CDS:2 [Ambispora gerdemannii]